MSCPRQCDSCFSYLLFHEYASLGKMWDRRELRRNAKEEGRRPCGVFIGHCEGLTHVSTKNDGRFLISNGKDQCIKLWDIRKAASAGDFQKLPRPPKDLRWDYRYAAYPGRSRAAASYRDDSVMTYSGRHETLQTLIRAYFSPSHTTGQRYIYTGSSSGTCVIYDVLTGEVARALNGHLAPVRDVSWHPYGPFLTTVSWDCQVLLWSTYEECRSSSAMSSCDIDAGSMEAAKMWGW